ncbi:succinate dehydrogenase assembly factor 2 [Dasania marina]|uniref:FAD assembly factor SdhE n=1 Tax=Dasania marina TaxID=471499 RepID=UPI00036FA7F0|nr:succinate dehydrogenase assembly factor 2 [Dasania marina]
MLSDQEFNRIGWASRRGMLELDLILVPFVEQRLRNLDADDLQRYLDLLESEDNDLFAWFLGRGKPEDNELAIIVNKIIAHVRPA